MKLTIHEKVAAIACFLLMAIPTGFMFYVSEPIGAVWVASVIVFLWYWRRYVDKPRQHERFMYEIEAWLAQHSDEP